MIGNLIYVGVPYLAPVDVTERRNLVYEFKSLIGRTVKGNLTAGVYFPFKAGVDKFTIFYQEGGVTKREKMSFSMFDNNVSILINISYVYSYS